MTFFIIVIALFLLLDVAALYWGIDSRDDIDGAEWERRRAWALSHLMHHD
jgi:hypothetical protein